MSTLCTCENNGTLFAPPDPRAEREQRRREIDALLREDARRHPAFATARKCALLAALEDSEVHAGDVGHVPLFLAELRAYEAARGGGRTPSPLAVVGYTTDAEDARILAAYERTRSLP
jgi:hypothetical protein